MEILTTAGLAPALMEKYVCAFGKNLHALQKNLHGLGKNLHGVRILARGVCARVHALGVALVLALLVAGAQPAAAQASDYKGYLSKGVALYNAGKYAQAQKHFTVMLRKFGSHRSEISGWINKCKTGATPAAKGTAASSQSRPVTAAEAAANRKKTLTRRTFSAGGVSFVMVKVEAGTFVSGGTVSGEEADGTQADARRYVTLTRDYYMGETEVTQALWQAVMGDNPSGFHSKNILRRLKGKAAAPSKYDQHPVENVTWDECQQFLERLNAMTGATFRLPTEAEWEYAARGGNRTYGRLYSGSNDAAEVAWFTGNSDASTHPVQAKSPNELGLYDMGGNVAEWCQNYIYDYPARRETDPRGPAEGTLRAYRGGSWRSDASYCQFSIYRPGAAPTERSQEIGLRLAM